MTDPISAFQTALVTLFGNDTELTALLGGDKLFDSPPRRQKPPYVIIQRHDVTAHDGDLTPGWDHRLVLGCWSDAASRKTVLAIAARILALAGAEALSGPDLRVTLLRHERTETLIDPKTGQARANLVLRAFSEPTV